MRRRKEAPGMAYTALARRSRETALLWAVGLVLAALLLPVVLVAAAVHLALRRWPDRLWVKLAAFGALPLAGLGVWALTVPYLGSAADGFGALADALFGWGDAALTGTDGWRYAGYGLMVGPFAGALWSWADQWYRERSPFGGQQSQARRERAEHTRKTRWAHARQQATYAGTAPEPLRRIAARKAVPLGNQQGPFLGRHLGGDLPWKAKYGRLQLPWDDTGHIHVEGRTQRGKSETVFGLAEWFLERAAGVYGVPTGGQVIYLNCKEAAPGKEPSRRLQSDAEDLAMSCNVLVPGYAPYDAMRGTADQVRNRLMDTQVFTEPHHEAGVNVTLAFGLEQLAAEGKPARDLADVLQRITDRNRVKAEAATSPFATRLLDMIDENSWKGTTQRYMSAAIHLAGWAGPANAGGWAFEDAAVSVLDFPTSSEPKAAQMLWRLNLADLIAYVTSPRRPRRDDGSFVPLLVIAEEVSALDADPIVGRQMVNLMERALGADARIVSVSQDVLGLGDERAQSAVLTNSTVVSFAQNVQAQKIAELAGTREFPEASGAYEGTVAPKLDTGTIRVQEQYAVNPNELRNLPRGRAVVLSDGHYAHLAATMAAKGYRLPDSPQVAALDLAFRQSRELHKSSQADTSRPDETGEEG